MIDIDVRRRLGRFRLDVRVRWNETGVTALFGRSGSGKTTLIDLIAGLARPDEGRIVVAGRTLFDSAVGINLRPEKRSVGYVFQDSRLFPHLNVERNLRYGMRRSGGSVDFDRVVEILGLEGLLERRPRGLSGGEKQRVAIGRALLTDPRILLMDEPLASLDAPRKEEILAFVERLRAELSIPIVYVSHVMDEVIRLADHMVVLSDGKVAATGPVEDVMSRLDLRPLTGRHEAGAVIAATVAAHDVTYGLTRLVFRGGELMVARLDLPVGARLRLRVRARDVSLSLKPPEETSVLNVLPGRVVDIGGEPGPHVDVLLALGAAKDSTPLWARITRKSVEALDLVPGKAVYAQIKSVALDRHSMGRTPAAGRFEGK